MNKQNFMRVLTIAFAMAVVAACQTTTPQMTTVDRVLIAADVSNAPYTKILVVALVPRRESARNLEVGLSGEFEAANVKAHSFVRESSSTEPTEEAIRELVESTGVDGVLVVSAKTTGAALGKQKEEQVDVQAQRYGGNLFGFFRYDYKDVERPQTTQPADYTLDVVLVSDFYDVKTEGRVYSVESSTAQGQTNYQIIMSESKAIVGRLKQDGLIR